VVSLTAGRDQAGGQDKPICRRTSSIACMIVYVSSSGSSGLFWQPGAKTAARLGSLAAQPAPFMRLFEALQSGAVTRDHAERGRRVEPAVGLYPGRRAVDGGGVARCGRQGRGQHRVGAAVVLEDHRRRGVSAGKRRMADRGDPRRPARHQARERDRVYAKVQQGPAAQFRREQPELRIGGRTTARARRSGRRHRRASGRRGSPAPAQCAAGTASTLLP